VRAQVVEGLASAMTSDPEPKNRELVAAELEVLVAHCGRALGLGPLTALRRAGETALGDDDPYVVDAARRLLATLRVAEVGQPKGASSFGQGGVRGGDAN
jgi:hypothetical protein